MKVLRWSLIALAAFAYFVLLDALVHIAIQEVAR